MIARSRPRDRVSAAIVILALPAALGLGILPWTALASAVLEVAQKGRAFSVPEAEIAPGTTLRFTNGDDYPHQIHVTGPGMEVDSSLENSGQVVDVLFPRSGTFQVRCGIHPRMRMGVRVQ